MDCVKGVNFLPLFNFEIREHQWNIRKAAIEVDTIHLKTFHTIPPTRANQDPSIPGGSLNAGQENDCTIGSNAIFST